MTYGSTDKLGPSGGGSAYWLLVDAEGRLMIVGATAHDEAAEGNPLQIGGVYSETLPAVADGDLVRLLMDAAGRAQVREGWTPALVEDETTGDSIKVFTVDSGEEWKINSILVEYVASATAGERIVTVEYLDAADDVVFKTEEIAGIIAEGSAEIQFGIGLSDPNMSNRTNTDFHMVELPELTLPAGYKVKIYDKAGKDPTGDDMIVHMLTSQRKA